MTLRRRLLLLALLPGLLLTSGGSVRVCLHALVGAQENCVACRAEASPCCGETSAGPRAASEGESSACCVHLEGAPLKIASKDGASASAAAPVALGLAPVAPFVTIRIASAPNSCARWNAYRSGSSPCASGRLPLRI